MTQAKEVKEQALKLFQDTFGVSFEKPGDIRDYLLSNAFSFNQEIKIDLSVNGRSKEFWLAVEKWCKKWIDKKSRELKNATKSNENNSENTESEVKEDMTFDKLQDFANSYGYVLCPNPTGQDGYELGIADQGYYYTDDPVFSIKSGEFLKNNSCVIAAKNNENSLESEVKEAENKAYDEYSVRREINDYPGDGRYSECVYYVYKNEDLVLIDDGFNFNLKYSKEGAKNHAIAQMKRGFKGEVWFKNEVNISENAIATNNSLENVESEVKEMENTSVTYAIYSPDNDIKYTYQVYDNCDHVVIAVNEDAPYLECTKNSAKYHALAKLYAGYKGLVWFDFYPNNSNNSNDELDGEDEDAIATNNNEENKMTDLKSQILARINKDLTSKENKDSEELNKDKDFNEFKDVAKMLGFVLAVNDETFFTSSKCPYLIYKEGEKDFCLTSAYDLSQVQEFLFKKTQEYALNCGYEQLNFNKDTKYHLLKTHNFSGEYLSLISVIEAIKEGRLLKFQFCPLINSQIKINTNSRITTDNQVIIQVLKQTNPNLIFPKIQVWIDSNFNLDPNVSLGEINATLKILFNKINSLDKEDKKKFRVGVLRVMEELKNDKKVQIILKTHKEEFGEDLV